LDDSEIDPLGNAGVHIGRRDHYALACRLIDRHPRRIALVQRSSTLVLGPEQGWVFEAEFHDSCWRAIGDGTDCLHVVSIDGIRRHRARSGSHFPVTHSSLSRLALDHDVVGFRTGRGGVRAIKMLPTGPPEQLDEDFKFDRQARIVLADFGDDVEALLVSDIGDHQCTLHLTGSPPRRMLELCIAWYDRCPSLTVEALAEAIDETPASLRRLLASTASDRMHRAT
jgi:hypothetical protein